MTTLASAMRRVVDDLVRMSQFLRMVSCRAVKWGEYLVVRTNGGLVVVVFPSDRRGYCRPFFAIWCLGNLAQSSVKVRTRFVLYSLA